MNPNFLCKCGHRNKMHVNRDPEFQYYNAGKICVEYRDAIFFKGIWYHAREEICSCGDFVPDNLKTLELMSESSLSM